MGVWRRAVPDVADADVPQPAAGSSHTFSAPARRRLLGQRQEVVMFGRRVGSPSKRSGLADGAAGGGRSLNLS